jgi:hypothetical protein
VAGQLFDHSQTEHRLLDGMVQHVKADQAGVEVAVRIDFRYRFSSTNAVSIRTDGGIVKWRRPSFGAR